MKKHIVSICFLLLVISPNMLAQVYCMQQRNFENISREILDNINELGMDCNLFLTELEGKYFNVLYQIDEQEYSFCGKRVAFFRGNAGTIKSTKKEYFDKLKQFVLQNGFLPSNSGQLIMFNEDEVKETGYNAVIISQSKKYLTNKEVVKRLKSQR